MGERGEGYSIKGIFEHYGAAEKLRDELRIGLYPCDFVEIEVWTVV
jgi:hypothetical protein